MQLIPKSPPPKLSPSEEARYVKRPSRSSQKNSHVSPYAPAARYYPLTPAQKSHISILPAIAFFLGYKHVQDAVNEFIDAFQETEVNKHFAYSLVDVTFDLLLP